jgi:hypothetical protein
VSLAAETKLLKTKQPETKAENAKKVKQLILKNVQQRNFEGKKAHSDTSLLIRLQFAFNLRSFKSRLIIRFI